MALVSDSHKFVYVSGGRNATGAVHGGLILNIPNLTHYEPAKRDKKMWQKFNKHMPARKIKKVIGEEKFNEYFKFTFVRNTYSWVVSSYFFWVKCKKYPMPKNYIMDMTCFQRVVDYYKTDLGKRYDECTDIRSQHSFISDCEGNVLLDFVGRFEHLQDDFNVICDKIGVKPIQLKVRNSSAASLNKPHSVGVDWREHYRRNPKAMGLIYKNWKRDIDHFGFKLEL